MNSIFISGAAAGIGRATALAFLKQGWLVGAYDINSEALSQLQRDIRDASGAAPANTEYPHDLDRLIVGSLDVTNETSWREALADFAQHTNGQLNLLFNNAGVLCSGDFTNTPLRTHQRLFAINVQGVMQGCYLAQPYLAAAAQASPGHARVINMSSASAIYGQPSLASYAASKFAVRGLTEALELEWEPLGIQVMDIMPLFVRTDMVTNMQANSITRLGVRLNADDIAAMVLRLSQYRGNRVHWPVGRQARLMCTLSQFTPNWLARLSNRWITR